MNASLTKVLLATDGSTDAILATRAAVDLSSKTGSGLHVVHAWQATPPYAYPSLFPSGTSPLTRKPPVSCSPSRWSG